MKISVDAIIFSAFLGEMNHYKESLTDLEEISAPPMQYLIGNYRGKIVALTHSGLGKVQATISFTLAFTYFAPKIALFTGTAGAVNLGLKTGSVIIGQRCIDADLFGVHKALTGTGFEEALKHRHADGLIPEEYFADERLVKLADQYDAPWKKIGCLGTSDNFPSPKEKIAALREAGVDTMDMEASAFYNTAAVFEIAALAIRSVSNTLDETGGDEAVHAADIRTADRPAAMALHIVGSVESLGL